MILKEQMDKIYSELSFHEIPWNVEDPPETLVDLVESGWIQPCETLDLGCGIGNYAMWFASNGFNMTGLDLSKNAIDLANKLAIQKGVNCQFMVKDMTEIVQDFDNIFNFAYDWEVLHHIFPENRKRYISNVHRMLRSNGKYFSLCFSEDEPAKFGGNGKYRKTPLGTTLYFSSEQELRDIFESLFIIEQLRTIEVRGKKGTHIAIKVLMRKKDT